jgi:TonB family protein
MGVSLAAHLLILALLIILRPEAGGGQVLAEIEYIPVSALVPRGAAEPVAAEDPPALKAAPVPERFRRAEPVADVAPAPQSDFALADRMAARLETLRGRDVQAASVSAPVAARWPAAGPADTRPAAPAPVALARGVRESTPLPLTRGAAVQSTRLDPATIATNVRPSEPRPDAATSITGAARDLAGARLAGPVADRPIVAHVAPDYPDWAKREAIEGSVTLRFFVRPDGSIKENVLVQKTAGFEDFDQSAVAALRRWRFQALAAGRTGEQWGSITFHFRLRDAG